MVLCGLVAFLAQGCASSAPDWVKKDGMGAWRDAATGELCSVGSADLMDESKQNMQQEIALSNARMSLVEGSAQAAVRVETRSESAGTPEKSQATTSTYNSRTEGTIAAGSTELVRWQDPKTRKLYVLLKKPASAETPKAK